MKFQIKVPASTSNMGPGFDSLGLALNIFNYYTFDTEAPELEEAKTAEDPNPLIYSSSYSPNDIPYSKENLCYRAFQYIFRKEGKIAAPIKINFDAEVPFTGGFGSSSTAILAGVMAANHILGEPYGEQELLKLGSQLDGHPDNITPSLLGGFVVCTYANREHNYVQLPWNDDLSFVAITPDFKTPTAKARSVLPAQVNYEDAVFNIGFSSLLVAAVAAKDTETLKKAFKDRLHQKHRARIVPGMQYVLDTGIEAGAVGTMLSGAGSTLLAVVDDKETAKTVALAMQAAWLQSGGIKAEYRFLKAENSGAELTTL